MGLPKVTVLWAGGNILVASKTKLVLPWSDDLIYLKEPDAASTVEFIALLAVKLLAVIGVVPKLPSWVVEGKFDNPDPSPEKMRRWYKTTCTYNRCC